MVREFNEFRKLLFSVLISDFGVHGRFTDSAATREGLTYKACCFYSCKHFKWNYSIALETFDGVDAMNHIHSQWKISTA